MTQFKKVCYAAAELLHYVKYYVEIDNDDQRNRAISLANALEKALKEFDEQP